jgi:hypothetical protein
MLIIIENGITHELETTFADIQYALSVVKKERERCREKYHRLYVKKRETKETTEKPVSTPKPRGRPRKVMPG